MKKIVVYLMNFPQDWINDNDDNKYIDENRVHITQGIIGGVSVFSVIGLVYFTLMSTLENRYQYAIVAGICLALSAFFLLYNGKNKRKMYIIPIGYNLVIVKIILYQGVFD